MEAALALTQVVLVSGIPTQLVVAVGFLLVSGGLRWSNDFWAQLGSRVTSLEFVAVTSLVDTALVALLIRLFLSFSGDTSREMFIGPRRPFGEIVRGLAVVPFLLIAIELLAYGVRIVAPSLHNVDENPYAAYMKTPLDAGIFIVVVTLAGGIREELQRAFILRRFERYLGGARLGLILFTVLFGLMHYPEGWDAALEIGLLGLFFGVLYLRRRSAVMTMTAHAGFDVSMVLLQVFGKALGI